MKKTYRMMIFTVASLFSIITSVKGNVVPWVTAPPTSWDVQDTAQLPRLSNSATVETVLDSLTRYFQPQYIEAQRYMINVIKGGGEAPTFIMLNIITDGEMDDSVRGIWRQITLENHQGWVAQDYRVAYRCWRGTIASQENYAQMRCN
ncbi:hypothetical protein [Spirabiliibacterium falconis]|uniref:hypothetical protein n=1 Tax=Spirabiliibacterium falconis TaxID=572023 RepID=UPI001AAC9997|nr:hypothetical protein [Spirabiliibacterium falconis]MBE2895243.1 hypothetical protein [Spirabiliibacterium falconis]